MRQLKMRLMFPVHVFRILRAMFTLWLLRKLTHPEVVPLTVYGGYVSHEGEIAIINYKNGETEIGEVTEVFPEEQTVYLRLFRRPK